MEPIKTIGQKLRGNELRDAIHRGFIYMTPSLIINGIFHS